LSISIILSLAGAGVPDDLLTRQGYRQVIRISGKGVIRIFGTQKGAPSCLKRYRHGTLPRPHTLLSVGVLILVIDSPPRNFSRMTAGCGNNHEPLPSTPRGAAKLMNIAQDLSL
jgi:hypothetical protein